MKAIEIQIHIKDRDETKDHVFHTRAIAFYRSNEDHKIAITGSVLYPLEMKLINDIVQRAKEFTA